MIGRDFRVKFLNRSGAGALRMSPEEATGKRLDELFPPDTAEKMMKGLKTVFESGKPSAGEMTHHFSQGDLHIHVSLNPIFDDDGKVSSVMGVSRDINDLKNAGRALRESEEKYRFLVENSNDIMWKIDLRGSFTFVSGNVEKLTGRRADEVVGTTIWDLLAPECHDLVRDKLRRRELGEELLPYEVLVIGRDGNKVPFELSTAALLDGGGKVVGVQGVSRDITRRKRAEEALRASEEKYRNLVENINDMVWESDLNGKCTYASPKTRDLLGYEPEELLGRTAYEFMAPEDAGRVAESYGQSKARREPLTLIRYDVIRKDGTRIVIETNGVPILDHDGNYKGYRGVNRDVTERVRAQEALRKSEEKFRVLAETTASAIVILQDNRVKYANPAVEKITGYSREEMLAMSPVEAASVIDPATILMLNLARFRRRGRNENLRYEIRLKAKDGKTKWVDVTTGVISYNGSPAFLATGLDITERKRAEEEVQNARKMLRLIMDNIPQGIFWKDRSSVYLGCNSVVARGVGIGSPEDIVGKTDHDLPWLPGQADEIREHDRKVMESDTPEYNIIEPLQLTGGESSWIEANKIPLHDAKGNVIGVLGTYEDITERKLAEEALRESEERLRRMAESIDEVFFIATPDWQRPIYVSTAYEKIMGLKVADLYQDSLLWLGVIVPEDRSVIEDLILRQIRGEIASSVTVEFRITKPDGSLRWIQASTYPILGEKGDVQLITGTARDITDRRQAEEALRVSEAGLARSQEIARMGSYFWDIARDRIEWSDEHYRILGCQPQEFPVKYETYASFVHPDDRERVHMAIAEAIDEHGRLDIDYRIVRRDGVVRMAHSEGEAIYDKLFGTIQDVTERKQAEEALRESEERFRVLAETSSAMILLYQGEYFKYANKAAERITGYSGDELLKMRFWDIVHPEFQEMMKERGLARQRGEEVPACYEFKILTKGGDVRWAECTIGLIEYKSRPAGIATVFDITERKRAEATLKRNQFILAKSQETAKLGNWAWNVQTDELSGSEENWRIVGFSPGTMRPTMHLYQQLVHPEDREYIARHTESVLREGQKCSCDYRIIRLDGSMVCINTIADKIVRDERGDIKWVYGINQDITERKKTEEMLAKAKADAELYLDLMSHDINNMNQAGIGFLELANDLVQREGKLEKKDSFLVEKPLEALWNSSSLIRSVRKLQQISTSEFSYRVFDLHQIMADVFKRYEHILDRDLTLKVSFNYSMDTHFFVRANDLIKDIFDNLINNAIKHSDPEKPLVITLGLKTVEEDGRRYHRASVEDNGPGIPDALKEKIFSRFQQGDTKASGKGLGLYIVKALVEKYGGSVCVEDRVPGDYARGARLVVILPAILEKPDSELK